MALAVHRHRVSLAGLVLLAGCVAPTKAPPPQQVAPPTYSGLGLESIMGHGVRDLETHLGKPALDVREGDARKLQFPGRVCVLDAYLYPPARGGEAVVTYLDARQPDGRDIDRASCVAALMLQHNPPPPTAPAPSAPPPPPQGQGRR